MNEIAVVGVVVALPQEVRGIRRLIPLPPLPDLPQVWKGPVGSKDLLIVCSGMGPMAAEQAADRLWKVCTPHLVIVAGVGGALTPEMRRMEMLVDTDERWLGERAMAAAIAAGLAGRLGRIATVPRPLTSPLSKRAVGQSSGAFVADMEQAPVKALCQARGIPFLGVRVVADAVDDDLTPLLGDWSELEKRRGAEPEARETPDFSMRFFVKRLLTTPSAIPVAWRLARASREGANTIGRFLAAFLPRI
ncbi:MAG: hypothetical protein HYZ73_04205 [Elusimicrobia bacterium]|nr:hypothetical protein [Elusimicrobiota bacterium]